MHTKIKLAIACAICLSGAITSCTNPASNEEALCNQVCIEPVIQSTFDSLLVHRMIALDAEAGYGAVMEVSTGNLLAISSWGRSQDSICHLQNSMFLDLRDPGTTFQAVSYAVLLETGEITPDSMNAAEEAIVYSRITDMENLVTEAYADQPDRFMEGIRQLGWYETPPMVYDGDTLAEGRVREYQDRQWSGVSLGHISYGYEMSWTPMHTLMFFNSIANGGIRPGVGRICSEQTAHEVMRALEGVVDYGTASTQWQDNGDIVRDGAKSQKVKIAGKSGRAQVYANQTYVGNGYYVTFVGYFPAEQPRYSCLVSYLVAPGDSINRPEGGYMAGPVVRSLAETITD